jgi:FkbM family methyltransferase
MIHPFKFSIVIPTYNHCDDLLKPCVESVIAFSRMTDVELVISANGCTDNTRAYVEQLQAQFTQLGFPDHVKLVWHDEALGFSRAVNAGIRASTGAKVLLLNNDVVLLWQPRNQWLDRLNAPFDADPTVGITTTLMLYSPQTGRDFAVFFCTLIDKRLIEQIGLLNEVYGVGAGEDTEYCLLAEEAGWRVVGVAKTRYEPSIGTNASDFPIWHKAEGTMHDPVLVPNWTELFNNNGILLTHRSNPTLLAHTPTQLADQFPQLAGTHADSAQIFDQILRNNSYHLTLDQLRNKEVIDVGANTGMFSLAAAAMGASRVWSYEPVSHTHALMLNNVMHTGLSHKITCVQQAVMGISTPPLMMGLHEAHGSNSLYTHSDQSELVSVTTLADIMAQTFSHNVILKLDCEGAEFDIILDSAPEVFDRIKQIHVQIHTQLHPMYNDPSVIKQRLTQLGFNQIRSQNIGTYWYNAQGEMVSWQPGPIYVEMWQK